jgi:hypothetical protein
MHHAVTERSGRHKLPLLPCMSLPIPLLELASATIYEWNMNRNAFFWKRGVCGASIGLLHCRTPGWHKDKVDDRRSGGNLGLR